MKRQIAKGLAMVMLTLALAAAAAVIANGQSNGRVVAQIPFDFVVEDKTLAAGDYLFGAIDQAGETIAICNRAGDSTLRLALRTERGGRDTRAKLIFHRYGNTYFLSQVWMAGGATGWELSKSQQERAMQRELKAVAANKPAYEIVEVLARAR